MRRLNNILWFIHIAVHFLDHNPKRPISIPHSSLPLLLLLLSLLLRQPVGARLLDEAGVHRSLGARHGGRRRGVRDRGSVGGQLRVQRALVLGLARERLRLLLGLGRLGR
jgi:hypothetical protein